MSIVQPASGTGPAMPAKSLSELTHMSIVFAGLCDALDCLYDTASAGQGAPMDETTRRARNAMTPIIDAIIRGAHELSEEIARTESALIREGRA